MTKNNDPLRNKKKIADEDINQILNIQEIKFVEWEDVNQMYIVPILRTPSTLFDVMYFPDKNKWELGLGKIDGSCVEFIDVKEFTPNESFKQAVLKAIKIHEKNENVCPCTKRSTC